MCNCIELAHKNMDEKVREKFGKPNKPVDYFSINSTLSGKAVINVSIKLQGQQKPAESFIVASYCPLCGVKYDDDSAKEHNTQE